MKKISKINIVFILLLFAFGLFQNTSVLANQSEDPDMRSILISEIQPDFDVKQLFSVDGYFSTTNYEINDYTEWITVTPITGLITTEVGGADTFTVVLNSQPLDDVSIGLSSDDLTEGTVLPDSLTFTNINWNTPQEVTVNGVDDDVDDDNQPYNIVLANSESPDPIFNNIDLPDVLVTNEDNDTAGVTVNPTTDLITTEGLGTDTFTVVLNSEPTADVLIELSSSDTSEGTVSPASLTFTSSDWSTAQTVTVTGVDEAVVDGNIEYTIITGAASSSDGNYSGMNASDVLVTNTDNDTAGVTVNPTSGLTTTEASGSDIFTVVLKSQPTANVTIGLSSSNMGEGTVSPASLTFTSSNWSTTQTVTVTGVDDDVVDGNIEYTIITSTTLSSDVNYSGKDVSDVLVTNTDNDTAGLTVNPTSGLTTTEASGSDIFTVVLKSQPTANVTIGLSSSNMGEGTVSPASLTFTSSNWSTTQTVTVTGVDDAVVDGNIEYTIITSTTSSSDVNYSGKDVSDVLVTNADNDIAGVTVNPTTDLITTEGLWTDTFTVVLNSEPTADVLIELSSSDTSEGTVSPASLTFTSSNWSTAQTVTVTGVDDNIDDENVGFSIITISTSSDSIYNGITVSDVSVTNQDNDISGVTVTPTSGLTTTEAGGIAQFSVRLNTEPSNNVVLSVSSQDETEGLPNKTTLTFTNSDWGSYQAVNVTGQDDQMDDGDVLYTVTVSYQSGAAEYNNLDPVPVSLTNIDNDQASLIVDPMSGLITSEDGVQADFSVKLATQPTQNFVLSVIPSDATEGTVDKPTLTFTNENWNINQVVTVTGVDDSIVDGPINYIIQFDGFSGAPEYMNLGAILVQIQNQDNDIAGVNVTPPGALTTTEDGGTDQFTISLSTQPASPVTINMSSSRPLEGLIIDPVNPTSVVLNSTNWSTGVVVTIQGQNDNIDDGDQLYAIVLSNTMSADPNYNNIDVPDKNVTNLDNDTAGVTITKNNLLTDEGGKTDTFSIYLNTEPTHNVTINISNGDPSEGSLSAAALEFTPLNYSTQQTITVTGVDDDFVDGNQIYQIDLLASSIDPNYIIDLTDVSVTNEDDDKAGISIDPDITMVTREDGTTDQFNVVLDAKPYGTVTIPVVSSDTTEGKVSPTSLTFTDSNWAIAQPVTVTGVDDDLQDGSLDYTINLGPATIVNPNDAPFLNLTKTVNASNSDNDTAGIFITQGDKLETSEAGKTAQFSVELNTQPLFKVFIDLTSSDPGEGVITAPASGQLEFTPANWGTPQLVTITGVDDILADGDQTYQITITVESAGDDYNNLLVFPVDIVNLDDDFPPVGGEDIYYINGDILVVDAPGILINDTDENIDDILTAEIQTSPAHASLFELYLDGSFTYQAQSDFEGVDTFTYKAKDGILDSDITTVYINVDKTPPPVANWVSPVTNGLTYTVQDGTIQLQAEPTNLDDFDHLWYAWYDPTIPGTIEDQLFDLGSAYVAPYAVSLNVENLDIGYNQIYVFAYDKAGNRSPNPNNRIIIERLPYYSQFIYLPIINN